MFLSLAGFVVVLFVLYKLLYYGVALIVDAFYNAEERLAGRQFVERIDDAGINRTIADGLAAFTPGRFYIYAGVIGAVAAILAVPFFHWLYAIWVRVIMLFTDTHAYAATVYGASMRQIVGYMLRIAINAVAFALIGWYYAVKRRKILQEDRVSRILFWRVHTVEVFGTVLGWVLYLVAALLPRYGPDGWFNFAGMLTLGGGWMWVLCGVLVSMYMQAAQNAVLWALFRYRWSMAIPAVIKMMALRRLEIPRTLIDEVTVDEAAGAATIKARIDPIDAERLRDSLLAVPGLHYPQVIALGPPPGSSRIPARLAPRMKPLPPRAFKRPQGPPKGYGAEYDLLAPADEEKK